jgi:putative sterol carrier protein
MASEVETIFNTLPRLFQKGVVKKPRTFYFSLDDEEKWTVTLTREACEVKPGKPAADADCFFKASRQMFLDIWNGKHVPGAKDFLMGNIKSNNPMLLKEFIDAFKRP